MKGSFAGSEDNYKITYDISEEQQRDITTRLLRYYATHLWFGEGIMQDDDSIIDAPEVLADICDNIIEFREEEIES